VPYIVVFLNKADMGDDEELLELVAGGGAGDLLSSTNTGRRHPFVTRIGAQGAEGGRGVQETTILELDRAPSDSTSRARAPRDLDTAS